MNNIKFSENIKNSILVSVIKSMKILSLISIVIGAVGLILCIGFGYSIYETLIMVVVILLSIFLLVIAENLSKRKKWAWYVGSVVFAVGFISSFFIHSLFKLFVGVISGLVFFGLLYCKKEYFKTES